LFELDTLEPGVEERFSTQITGTRIPQQIPHHVLVLIEEPVAAIDSTNSHGRNHGTSEKA